MAHVDQVTLAQKLKDAFEAWDDIDESPAHHYTEDLSRGKSGERWSSPEEARNFYDVGLRMALSMFADKVIEPVALALGRCESPIEEAFFFALMVAAADQWHGCVRFKIGDNDIRGETDECTFLYGIGHRITIEPQAKLGSMRVDFLITHEFAGGWRKALPRPESLSLVRSVQVVVECDGHDFHDRTKEQASRDRERDRELQASGFNVFRFTGSDIYADAFGCAAETTAFLLGSMNGESA